MPKQVTLTFEPIVTQSTIPEISPGSMMRARIPGGWLVLSNKSGSTTFVPDPKGIWNVEEPNS